jgi:hypothetical protein
MSMGVCLEYFQSLPALLRGEPGEADMAKKAPPLDRIIFQLLVLVGGAALYGVAAGCWRGPLQAFYTAVKFPLVLLATSFGNALLNGMLAPLLGLNISLRQSFFAVLTSFTIASVILASFSPLLIFSVWNAPPLAEAARAGASYSFILVLHVAAIAVAGLAANLRLLQLLDRLGGSRTVAHRILLAWLVGNLFFGSQISWILRPFIGSPGLPIEFVRPNAFHGNFYEAVFRALSQLFD